MRSLYTIFTYIAMAILWMAQFFSTKLKLFNSGRKATFAILNNNIQPTDKTVWFHCASLGEYEQGLPIMEEVKKLLPTHKIVISFFSPSGHEVRKNAPIADAVVYLPMDTRKNAAKFLSAVHPSLSFFVKYEFWPNYLLELKKRDTPTLLIAGVFRKKQVFFKSYGSFMRKALQSFRHIFVQERSSEKLLHEINLTNVTVSGDTRFDRVSHQIEQDNSLDFADTFKGNKTCIVCGSTWPEDEAVLLEYINSSPTDVKFIIAPHKIDTAKIESFRKKITKSVIQFSQKENAQLDQYSVLIIDNIGLLSKVFSYADIAYVGGAMGNTGLHNILEPATFGIPIVIGNNFEKFPEARRLQQLAGLFSVSSEEECSQVLNKLVTDKNFRNKTGMICGHFVNSNTGATRITMDYVKSLHTNGLI